MANDSKFKYDVYLSYSSLDKPRVHSLADRLQKEGLQVWFDDWEIKPADSIPLKIEEGLKVSRCFVLCMSRWAFGSRWVGLERSAAIFRDPANRRRSFIPVLLEDCEIPDTIRQLKCLDYRVESEMTVRELVSACRGGTADLLPMPVSSTPDPSSILPLYMAEDRYLQILLSQFSLSTKRTSSGNSFTLSVAFDDNTPAIWGQEGKRYLRSIMPPDRREKYQKVFDDYLLLGEGNDNYKFNDPSFFFRYVSGGTLPIVSVRGDRINGDYYCLFYREVHPIGWNIANGASDNRRELLDPQSIIDRELREELIIADFDHFERFVFRDDAEKSLGQPLHAVARQLWAQRCPDRDPNRLRPVATQIEWLPGPDSVCITGGDDPMVEHKGFFLNINGEDFGIELDRVARITLPDSVILYDGELENGKLVNAPVGLFEVGRFNHLLRENLDSRYIKDSSPQLGCYKPDFFFFNAEPYPSSGKKDIDEIISDFTNEIREFRTAAEMEELERAKTMGTQYGLCPATEAIVRRFVQRTSSQSR